MTIKLFGRKHTEENKVDKIKEMHDELVLKHYEDMGVEKRQAFWHEVSKVKCRWRSDPIPDWKLFEKYYIKEGKVI